jgi:hypothetical protein
MPAATGATLGGQAKPTSGGTDYFTILKQISDLTQKKQGLPFPDFKLAPADTAPLHPIQLHLQQLNTALPQNLPFAGNSGTGTG